MPIVVSVDRRMAIKYIDDRRLSISSFVDTADRQRTIFHILGKLLQSKVARVSERRYSGYCLISLQLRKYELLYRAGEEAML